MPRMGVVGALWAGMGSAIANMAHIAMANIGRTQLMGLALVHTASIAAARVSGVELILDMTSVAVTRVGGAGLVLKEMANMVVVARASGVGPVLVGMANIVMPESQLVLEMADATTTHYLGLG